MRLGSPFIDRKTSSDMRDRDPVNFKPSPTKPAAPGKSKHAEATIKTSKT